MKAWAATEEQFALHRKAEARRVWELYQSGTIRELYFRGDRSDAVLILECTDLEATQQVLASLPLVKAGLITFEIIALIPYLGFARAFRSVGISALKVFVPHEYLT